MLPSLREKKRYIAFEIISKKPIKALKSVKKAIELSMLSFVGIKGSAKAGLIFIDETYNNKTQRGLVRVDNKYTEEVKSSLALIKEIDNTPVAIRSVGASGTIKQAENKYIAG